MSNENADGSFDGNLSAYLKAERKRVGLSLRAVEEATEREISNGYLSQLENGKVSKPSPHILHSLAEVYGSDYELLMQKAGYISRSARSNDQKHGKAATRAIDNLSQDEEKELLNYLTYIRTRPKD